MRRTYEQFVYFLRPVGADGPVKIGCSEFPERRLMAYAAWSPLPLELLARIPGSLRVERQFHEMFRAQHSHGEWFHASPLLTRTIQRIAAGEFDPSELPAKTTTWRKTQFVRSDRSKRIGSLRMRFGLRTYGVALTAPKHMSEACDNLDALYGVEFEAAVRLVESYIADPLTYGVPSPNPSVHRQADLDRFKEREERRRQRDAA